MSVIRSLVGLGYMSDDILNMIVKDNPRLGSKFSRLLAHGYTAANILSHIDGGGKHSSDEYLTSEQKFQEEEKKHRRKENIGFGTAALGLAGGLGMLARGGAAAGAAAQGIAGAIPPGGNPQIPQQVGQLPSGAAQPASPSLSPQVGPPTPIPQSPTAMHQKAKTLASSVHQHVQQQSQQDNPPDVISQSPSTESIAPPTEPKDSLSYYQTKHHKGFPDLEQFIKKHRVYNKTPEHTEQMVRESKKYGSHVEKVEKETKRPFLESVKEIYGGKGPGGPDVSSSIVMTPMGAGEVKATKGGNSYVSVGNKLHKLPASELTPPPEDVREAVQNMLKIPEKDRSSNVALFLYDPAESKAIFQFHDGSAYKYLDIEPEIVRKIAEKEAIPITQGKNVYGEWSPSDEHGSLGAALWAYVLKNPKWAKSRKGEAKNTNYEKLETLYDYWEKLRKKKK